MLLLVHKWSRGVAVNMPACHAGDRRFDPGRDRHLYNNNVTFNATICIKGFFYEIICINSNVSVF